MSPLKITRSPSRPFLHKRESGTPGALARLIPGLTARPRRRNHGNLPPPPETDKLPLTTFQYHFWTKDVTGRS